MSIKRSHFQYPVPPEHRSAYRVFYTAFLFIIFFITAAQADPIPISGTHLLPRTEVPYHPVAKIQSTPVFQVGDALTIPAFSFQFLGGHYQTTVTCRLVGDNCYILVEEEIWQSRVSQSDIESLAQAFDQSTPRDSTRGIFDISTSIFGDPPDVDGDPRILIAIIDILDSPIQGFSIVGYFDVENQAPPVSHEILYLDANPFAVNSDLARATITHEFQHLTHWNADPKEEKWLDEGCSEYAELACGYKDTTASEMDSFLSLATNTDLTKWEDQSWDFDHAYLWVTYFVQTYGEAALRTLIADPDSSILSVNNTLQALNKPERFDHLFGQWAAAVYRDDYTAIDLGTVKSNPLIVPTDPVTRQATLWGVDYLTLGDTSNLALTIGPSDNNDLLLTLIHTDSTRPLSAPLTIPSGQTRRIHTYGSANRVLAITTTSGTGAESGYTLSIDALTDGHTPQASDFDANGEVGFSDFLAFASGFGKNEGDVGFDPTFDLNNDLKVAFADFLIFVHNFGQKL
ncbi:MAG: hypothetical protein HN521_14170 [Candidatus Latescibacteria bacterium]|nr:hypothetical protein [Candidatus Latescibacterota bacterium]